MLHRAGAAHTELHVLLVEVFFRKIILLPSMPFSLLLKQVTFRLSLCHPTPPLSPPQFPVFHTLQMATARRTDMAGKGERDSFFKDF